MNSDLKNNLAEALYKTGNFCLTNGDFIKAAKNYERAVEINPNFFKAFCNLGVAYKNLNILSKSEEAFRKALSLSPKDHLVLNNLGNLYVDLKQYSKAEKAYQNALAITPNYRDALYNLEQLYIQIGKISQAMECRVKLEAIFQSDPFAKSQQVIISSR